MPLDSIDEKERKLDIELSPQASPKNDIHVHEERDELGSEPYSAFPKARRTLIITVVTLAGFLGPVSGNIYIPILPLLRDVYKVSATCINGTVSVFMLIFGIAPLIWAAWADFGGRKTLYLISLAFFILANILIAVVPPEIGALYALRVVQAFGASSVVSVGAGTVADITEPRRRATVISYFMLGPQLGPIIGPLLSTIATNGHWRWIFGFLAIFGLVVYLIILFFLPETLRCLVGNGQCYQNKSWFLKPALTQKKLIRDNSKYPSPMRPTIRSFWKAFKFKPVALCSINGGLLFAAFYAMSITFTVVLQGQYNFSGLQTSLSYICPGISLISGSLIGGRLSDFVRLRMLDRYQEKYVPEHRFPLQLLGLLVSITGILGYGWCVDHRVHVSAVFVFFFLGGFGMTWVFVMNTTYLTECSTGQPATNVALGNLMRNLAAAISSLIIEKLIQRMGFGWCFTGLSILNLIGVGFVILLSFYGPRWREAAKR